MRRRIARIIALAITFLMMAFFALGVYGSRPIPRPATPGPDFDAFAFFSGDSTGTAQLSTFGGSDVPVRVTSHGEVQGDTLILRQTITQGDDAPRDREWRLNRDGPNRYKGTLTDAKGPVTATEDGSRLTISYAVPAGYRITQILDRTTPDRAENVLRARIFGLPLARLDETITRTSP